MKALILGLGQSAILLSQLLEKQHVEYRIAVRRSTTLIKPHFDSCLNPDKIEYVSVINETNLIKIKTTFDFTHIFNFYPSNY